MTTVRSLVACPYKRCGHKQVWPKVGRDCRAFSLLVSRVPCLEHLDCVFHVFAGSWQENQAKVIVRLKKC